MDEIHVLAGQIEALLFAYGEPIEIMKLAKASNTEEEKVREALEVLQDKYASHGGLTLLRHENKCELGTKPEFSMPVETLIKSEMHEELSRAAAETLAIVAYKGPLTRTAVEYIRGVNSSFTMRNLLMRGLVERRDNPNDMRAPLYQITFEYLKHLGLNSIEELPGYTEFRTKLESISEHQ